MKYFLFIISMLLVLSYASPTTCAQKLYIRENSGVQTDYSLTDISKLTFTAGNLHIMKAIGGSDEYQLAGLRYLSFSEIIIRIDDPPMDDTKAFFKICPNPAGESITIIPTGDKSLSGIIEMINPTGRIVKTQVIKGGRELEVDLRDMGKGLYLCRFRDGNKVQTLKFIKQ